jgi:hypothetical protein
MTLSWLDFALAALAAILAGMVNALAGGGTLITFPVLTALGLPAVVANVTSTVALSPGYLGGVIGQADDLRNQKPRLWQFLPVAAAGGLIGALLLLYTGERIFRAVVPYLILLASGLLAVQNPVRAWVTRRAGSAASQPGRQKPAWLSALPVGLAAVYGGYFGAGVSVIVLAVLGLVLDDTLTRLNALKQAISFATNLTAAVFFIFSGQVVWPVALVMAVGALLGGVLGGRLAGWIKPAVLRGLVVTIGVVVAIIYLVP